MPATSAARFASRLRASATISQWPGTTLPEVPPRITPTLAVVSSSSRPSSMRAIAAEAAAIALLPSSGRIPAWASTPVKSARTLCWVGEVTITSPTALAWSRTKPHLERSRLGVEGLGAAQTLLLGDGQQQLDPDRRRPAAPGVARDELDEDRDRRLVVGAEDRLAGAAEDAVGFDHLDLALVRNGVDVSAEHHPLVALTRQPREQVAGAGFRRPGGVVLAHLEPKRAQLGGNRVRHLALLARGATDLAETNERLVQSLHGPTG